MHIGLPQSLATFLRQFIERFRIFHLRLRLLFTLELLVRDGFLLCAERFLNLVARDVLGSVRIILLSKFTQIVPRSLVESKGEFLVLCK